MAIASSLCKIIRMEHKTLKPLSFEPSTRPSLQDHHASPASAGKCLMAQGIPAVTRSSLQADVLVAGHLVVAARSGCARCTPGAFDGTRASNPGAGRPTWSALGPGSPGSQDRPDGVLAASTVVVPADTRAPNSRSASVFAAGDERIYRSQRIACSPWTDLLGGNYPVSVRLSSAIDKSTTGAVNAPTKPTYLTGSIP